MESLDLGAALISGEIGVLEAAWGYNVKGDLLEKELTAARKVGNQMRVSELETALTICRENEGKMYEQHWAQEKEAVEYYNAHAEELEKLLASEKYVWNENIEASTRDNQDIDGL